MAVVLFFVLVGCLGIMRNEVAGWLFAEKPPVIRRASWSKSLSDGVPGWRRDPASLNADGAEGRWIAAGAECGGEGCLLIKLLFTMTLRVLWEQD
jgi:hypothetical protein